MPFLRRLQEDRKHYSFERYQEAERGGGTVCGQEAEGARDSAEGEDEGGEREAKGASGSENKRVPKPERSVTV